MGARAPKVMDAKKPYVIATIIVVIYTGMYVSSKAAFNHGMNTFVFIFYRQAAASLILLPMALLLERTNLRSLSFGLLMKLFFCALIGEYTKSKFDECKYEVHISNSGICPVGNSTPVITFCLALLFRMEVLKLRSSHGIAKVAGVGFCPAGALVIAFYAGSSLSPVNHHRAFAAGATHMPSPPRRETWIIGTFLVVLGNGTWSLWIILQAALLTKYPNRMLVTTVQCVFSKVQSFVVASVAERDFSRWKLGLDVSLLAVIYSGFVVTGVANYMQAWCLEMKGPVFLAAWSPLVFVLTTFCSSLFLGEIVHLGSIVGGILLVCGLYSLLWGKNKESKTTPRSRVNAIEGVQDEQEKIHQEKEQGYKEESKEETSTSATEQV
ncbi:hypothetical protein ACP70R_021450 [Stipagrostis hirtigluma subsp. patula]